MSCASTSEVRCLGPYGKVQICGINAEHLDKLHAVCDDTSAFVRGKRLDPGVFGEALSQLLQQRVAADTPMHLWKVANGYALTVPRKCPSKGGGFQRRFELVSAIKTSKPNLPCSLKGPDGPRALLYCLMPRADGGYEPIFMEKDNVLTALNEISRITTIEHLFRQVHALEPYTNDPRILFHAKDVGVARIVRRSGAESYALKASFLSLAKETASNGGCYGKLLQVQPGLSKLLLMKSANGNVHLDPCADGVVAYRTRTDGSRSLVLVCTSPDYHEQEQADIDSSIMDVLKVDYANPSPDAPRIWCLDNHLQCTGDGQISLNMTVHQILNVIEKFFRVHNLAERAETRPFARVAIEAERLGLCKSDSEDDADHEAEVLQLVLAFREFSQAMSTAGYPISLGQSTHTLADTAARHHFVGRICTNMYQSLVEPNLVISNKEEYVAIREEMALGIGRSYNDKVGVSPGANCKGPTPVITNVAPFRSKTGGNDLMSWYVRLYDCRTVAEMRTHITTPCTVKGHTYFPPELYFAGFVMNHNAQAHPVNGDTAVTLFIGGVMTVKNGRFPVKGGDKVQWYLEDEADCDLFDPMTEGLRRPRELEDTGEPDPTRAPLDRDAWKLKTRQYGDRAGVRLPVLVKACRPGLDGKGCTVMDLRRVFAVALGDAGPFEKIDIKVSHQSI